MPEEASVVAHTRYEVRVGGRLSERECSAFCPMEVTSVPTQTIVYGELAAPSDLADLLALCMAMGLEVVSLRQLPGEAVTRPGPPAPGEAGWAVPVTPFTPRSGPSGLPPRPCIR